MSIKQQKRTYAEAVKSLRDVDKKQQTRMNLMIDKEIYRLMKIRAAEEEKSVSEITRELWKEYLK